MSDEITAEFEVKDLTGEAAPERTSVVARVTLGAKTDLGRVRENNEDKFDWLEPEDDESLSMRGRLYAVADGMGGHAAGQIASELALKTLLRTYYARQTGSVAQAITEGFRAANALVWETSRTIPGRSGMGTTLTALALHGDRAIIGQLGDSRAYLLRDGILEQITEDHSWVAEQVRAGLMTEEEAEESPYRNIITRSIGAHAEATPDLFQIHLRSGDRFLLCSDGLTGAVNDEEIQAVLEEYAPSVAAGVLIDMANEYGGPDNITCLILRIDEVPGADEGSDSVETEERTMRLSPSVPVQPTATETPDASVGATRRRGLFGWRGSA